MHRCPHEKPWILGVRRVLTFFEFDLLDERNLLSSHKKPQWILFIFIDTLLPFFIGGCSGRGVCRLSTVRGQLQGKPATSRALFFHIRCARGLPSRSSCIISGSIRYEPSYSSLEQLHQSSPIRGLKAIPSEVLSEEKKRGQ